MENDLFSLIRELAVFQRPAIDSLALKSTLELCFDSFKTGVPGTPAVVGPGPGGGCSRPSVHPLIHTPPWEIRLHPCVDPGMY